MEPHLILGIGELLWDLLPSGPRLTGSGGDRDMLDLALPQNVHDIDELLHRRFGITAQGHLRIIIATCSAANLFHQFGKTAILAIDLQLLLPRKGDDDGLVRIQMLGMTGSRQNGGQPGCGNDVDADENEKYEQKHHHIDHRDDFDAGMTFFGLFKLNHGKWHSK